MERTIVHLDLDTFFVSVERKLNSQLDGVPVIIGGSSDRGVVASCSYEARRYGVSSAMPMRQARRLCPEAFYVRGDMDVYARHSKTVTDIIAELAPVFEKTSIDEHYLDISGLDKYFGCLSWTSELRQRIIKESGLPISFGLSVNKTISKIATGLAKPNGGYNVRTGSEKPFLAPLSTKRIPMVGAKTYLQLRNLGLEQIRTVQSVHPRMMRRVLGENGALIWQKANGIDASPVIPYQEKKSISKEHTFDKDTTDMHQLRTRLSKMVEELCFELRADNRLTACVTVKLRYSNFDTHTLQARIPPNAADHVLLQKTLELFEKQYSRRMLVRLVGVKFGELCYGHHQINLFNDTLGQIQLYQALDGIRTRFGQASVRRANTVD